MLEKVELSIIFGEHCFWETQPRVACQEVFFFCGSMQSQSREIYGSYDWLKKSPELSAHEKRRQTAKELPLR